MPDLSEVDRHLLLEAIQLSRDKSFAGQGGPFGAIIARDGEVVGRGWNRVTSKNDPTAHAEVEAIRDACHKLNTFSLAGCVLYASCEPCPMCLAAVYWARLSRLVYAATRDDAANAGFDDAFLYKQIPLSADARDLPTENGLDMEARTVLREWAAWDGKTPY